MGRINVTKWPVFTKRAAGIACLTIVLLAIPTATRITLVEDITALLPSKNRSKTSLADLARTSGLMTKVLIAVGPVKQHREKLHQLVDKISTTVQGITGVKRVLSRGDSAAYRRTAKTILEHAFRLHRPRLPNGKLGDIETRLTDLKIRLASPEAMVIGSYLAADPLGVARQTLAGLESQAVASGTVTEAGHFLSTDRTAALIILELDFDPHEVSKSQVFVSTLDKKIREAQFLAGTPEMNATALGGVHYVAANAGSAEKDVLRAFAATSILVLLVFLLLFRRIRVLPAALIPGGVGIVVALGVFGATGYPLHPLTLGFAATITGMSVDYAIHLLYRARTEQGNSSEGKIRLALAHTSRPIILGCLTTLGAFLLVGTSSFTGIRQLALFSAISIPIAMIVTLLGLPAFHSFLARDDTPGLLAGLPLDQLFAKISKGTCRVATLVLFGALFALGSYFAYHVELSGDPRDLGSQNSALKIREARVRESFPSLLEQTLLVTSGGSLEDALWENDNLYGRLIDDGIDRDAIVSLSSFLPSPKTQQKSLEILSGYLFDGDSRNDVRNAFLNAGFTEEYYASLKSNLDAKEITPQTYRETSLSELVEDSIVVDGAHTRILTRVRAKDDSALSELQRIASDNPAWSVASQRLETHHVLELFQKELVRMLATWILATMLVLSLLERSVLYGIRTILPALFGVLVSVGLFAFLKRPLTPVASAGLTLVLGLGIDYGLFMQSRTNDLGRTSTAIIASAMTTIAAFGVLGFAETRAMADMGIIILVGVCGSLLAAIGLLPALNGRNVK